MAQLTYKTILLAAMIVITGCSHDIVVKGKGSVVSASGDHDCYWENSPCTVDVVYDYNETYTAIPTEGWAFDRWENCPVTDGLLGADGAVCTLAIPAKYIKALWGQDLGFALEAKFVPTPFYRGWRDGVRDGVILNSTIDSCESTHPQNLPCDKIVPGSYFTYGEVGGGLFYEARSLDGWPVIGGEGITYGKALRWPTGFVIHGDHWLTWESGNWSFTEYHTDYVVTLKGFAELPRE